MRFKLRFLLLLLLCATIFLGLTINTDIHIASDEDEPGYEEQNIVNFI